MGDLPRGATDFTAYLIDFSLYLHHFSSLFHISFAHCPFSFSPCFTSLIMKLFFWVFTATFPCLRLAQGLTVAGNNCADVVEETGSAIPYTVAETGRDHRLLSGNEAEASDDVSQALLVLDL